MSPAGRIVRYIVRASMKWSGDDGQEHRWYATGVYRTRREAEVDRPPGARIDMVELVPNPRIIAGGVDKADALIEQFDDSRLFCSGTYDELVESGLVPAYLFEPFREPGVRARSLSDEFGNRCRLIRRSNLRAELCGDTYFELGMYFDDEAQAPHANSKRPPGAPRSIDDVDIGPLLERFSTRAVERGS